MMKRQFCTLAMFVRWEKDKDWLSDDSLWHWFFLIARGSRHCIGRAGAAFARITPRSVPNLIASEQSRFWLFCFFSIFYIAISIKSNTRFISCAFLNLFSSVWFEHDPPHEIWWQRSLDGRVQFRSEPNEKDFSSVVELWKPSNSRHFIPSAEPWPAAYHCQKSIPQSFESIFPFYSK